jgi:hypothetical protein
MDPRQAHIENIWRSIHHTFLREAVCLYPKLDGTRLEHIVFWLNKCTQFSFFDTTRDDNNREMWKRGWQELAVCCSRKNMWDSNSLSLLLELISDHAPRGWLEKQAIQSFHDDWSTFSAVFRVEPFASRLLDYIRSHRIALCLDSPYKINYYIENLPMPAFRINDDTGMLISQDFLCQAWMRITKSGKVRSLHEICKSSTLSILFRILNKEFGDRNYNIHERAFHLTFIVSICHQVAPFVVKW